MLFNRDLYFNNPENGFFLLLLLPIILLYFFYTHYKRKNIDSIIEVGLREKIVQNYPKIDITKAGLLSFIWLLLTIALMDPRGNIRYESNGENNIVNAYPPQVVHNVILLMDVSNSMSVADTVDQRSRLERAKEIAENLVAQLQGTTYSAYGLTSVLTPLVPQTMDTLFLRLIIRGLDNNSGEAGGTLFLPVLKELSKQDEIVTPGVNDSLVIFSDGGDNTIEKANAETKPKLTQQILNAIPDELLSNIKIYTVGLGSNQPEPIPGVKFEGHEVLSKLDPSLLEALANKGHGQYINGNSDTSWNVATHLADQITEDMQNEDKIQLTQSRYRPSEIGKLTSDRYFQVPLGLALLLLPLVLIISRYEQ